MSSPGTQVQLGRARVDLKVYSIRPLTLEDLHEMDEHGPSHSSKPLEQVKARHHRAAELMVLGYKDVEIARIVNLSQTSLSLFRKSPAFMELLAHYEEEQSHRRLSVLDRMDAVCEDSLERLQDAIQNDDELSPEFLLKTTLTLADRTGRGPTTKTEARVVHTYLTRADIEDLKEKANVSEQGEVHRGLTEPESGPAKEERPALAEVNTSDRVIDIRPLTEAERETASQPEAADGIESQGQGV